MTPERTFVRASAETIIPGEFSLSRDDFRRISDMIYADAGIALHEGKEALVYARLAKRLRALRMQAFADYCDLVDSPEGADERQEMLAALTTNVTKFFREPHHFEHLKTQILTPFLQKGGRSRLRIWSAACSTGQEPYSIAMTLLSVWPDAVNHDVKILATDIDRKVLATAEAGQYGEAQMEGLRVDLRRRFFEPARRPVPRRVDGAQADLVPAAQSRRILADAGSVPGDLLPQRRHLFRRTDATGGLGEIHAAAAS